MGHFATKFILFLVFIDDLRRYKTSDHSIREGIFLNLLLSITCKLKLKLKSKKKYICKKLLIRRYILKFRTLKINLYKKEREIFLFALERT